MKIVPLLQEHYPEVALIYKQGLATGIASFETSVPDWERWDCKFLKQCRYVAIEDSKVIGWCALSAISRREVYKGVAENTVYVAPIHRGKGIGKSLLTILLDKSEEAGFYSLQASIFPENIASIALHKECGFRIIGVREKIAMRDNSWYDNILMEHRSKTKLESSSLMEKKNILVLCTGNSCRSQMAHGYLKQLSKDKANIYSAGIETHGLNPGAVAIMAEDGVSISSHTSNHVNEYDGVEWDYIITVCDHANENCPFIPAPKAKRLHHNFFDPSKVSGTEKEIHEAFLKARNEIKEYCRSFMENNL